MRLVTTLNWTGEDIKRQVQREALVFFPSSSQPEPRPLKPKNVEERRASKLRQGGKFHLWLTCSRLSNQFECWAELTAFSITTACWRPRKEWGKIVWRKEIKQIKYTVNSPGELSNFSTVTLSFSRGGRLWQGPVSHPAVPQYHYWNVKLYPFQQVIYLTWYVVSGETVGSAHILQHLPVFHQFFSFYHVFGNVSSLRRKTER